MNRADLVRAAAIYLPLTAAVIARLLVGRHPRQFVACLLSILWTIPSLLLLQICNQHAHWWSFAPGYAAEFRGMPLELFLGWIILWGLLPQLAFPRLGIIASAALLAALDCVLMPISTSIVILESNWLMGEALGVTIVLFPSLCLGHWTSQNTNLRARGALQIATAGLLFLFLIPEIIFATRDGNGWTPMLGLPSWLLQTSLQLIFLLALPGNSAVFEFVDRGRGTPIPYDPPQRLVTTGIYRYSANPMQLSAMLVMLAWAALLRNGWMVAAASTAFLYSTGIAQWDEKQDLADRFGQPWHDYRASVGNWLPHWIPYHAGPSSIIYVSRTCGPCSEVREWLERRRLTGLQIVDAETLPANSISRVRYEPADGTPAVEGVLAIGRALEHINLGWALCGMFLRLPILWRIIQLLIDASGLGPRQLPA